MKTTLFISWMFPIVILITGFVTFYSNLHFEKETTLPVSYTDSTVTQTVKTDVVAAKNTDHKRSDSQVTTRSIKKTIHPQSALPACQKALPYYILASALTVILLSLPRLQELTISQQALVLKLFTEVKEAADHLQTTADTVGPEAVKTDYHKKVAALLERVRMVDKVLFKGN